VDLKCLLLATNGLHQKVLFTDADASISDCPLLPILLQQTNHFLLFAAVLIFHGFQQQQFFIIFLLHQKGNKLRYIRSFDG
jgi:hypothetical protein